MGGGGGGGDTWLGSVGEIHLADTGAVQKEAEEVCKRNHTHTHPYMEGCTCVKVRGQLMGAGFLLPLCGFWKSKSGFKPWQQAPLPSVPSYQTNLCFVFL